MFTSPNGRAASGRAFALLAAAWVAVASPLTTLGYGSDVDAWLVGQRAFEMWTTGIYARSRSTGFPLYEITVTPLVVLGGWVATNALSVACTLAIFALIYQLAAERTLRHPLTTLVTFAALPTLLKNGTSTMDYVPALAVLLGSYVALQRRRPLLCACLVGVACGIRPTSGLFIIPAMSAVMVDSRRLRTPILMGVTALLVGILAFFPSLRLGGFGIAPVTGLLNGALNGMRLLGIAQTLFLIAALVAALRGVRARMDTREERAFITFHTVNILVWTALFAWLPGEPEYLLLTVPSLLLVLDRYASSRLAAVAGVVLASYHVVALEIDGSRGGLRRPSIRMVPGLTWRDVADRRFKLWLREATTQARVDRPLLFMEQIIPPVVGNDAFAYDASRDVFVRRDGLLWVSQRITEVPTLVELRREGVRVVAWREREWEYLLPANRAAHDLVEFIDDPGALLGVPVRGRPADLPASMP